MSNYTLIDQWAKPANELPIKVSTKNRSHQSPPRSEYFKNVKTTSTFLSRNLDHFERV